MARRPLAVALLTAAAMTACSNPNNPSSDGPVRLRSGINQAIVNRGEAATLSFRLENVSQNPVTLNFGSSCHILPYITDRQTAKIVHPAGGGWACLTVLTQLELAPGAVETVEVQVRAADVAAYPFVALAPGEYEAYATVEASQYKRRSASVTFTVR
ncbi:MAG TPA: BsuPI-related putative proteinase inhibitor [Vicinamibacterales bacterium]|jgi:hypothetical protein|nr:BsuPI-related putative proteinase inhibitor [Vicinamibacterales bacterium]